MRRSCCGVGWVSAWSEVALEWDESTRRSRQRGSSWYGCRLPLLPTPPYSTDLSCLPRQCDVLSRPSHIRRRRRVPASPPRATSCTVVARLPTPARCTTPARCSDNVGSADKVTMAVVIYMLVAAAGALAVMSVLGGLHELKRRHSVKYKACDVLCSRWGLISRAQCPVSGGGSSTHRQLFVRDGGSRPSCAVYGTPSCCGTTRWHGAPFLCAGTGRARGPHVQA